MTVLQFFASLIESLAWPSLVAFLAWGFKGQIATLLGRLAKLRVDGKKIEAEFAREVAEVAASTEKHLGGIEPLESLPSDQSSDTLTLRELVELSPRAGVLESWIKIEKATRDYIETIGLPRRMFYQGLRRLPPEHRVPVESILDTYQKLRVLRSKVTHMSDADINSVVANDYLDAASKVVAVIRKATAMKRND